MVNTKTKMKKSNCQLKQNIPYRSWLTKQQKNGEY